VKPKLRMKPKVVEVKQQMKPQVKLQAKRRLPDKVGKVLSIYNANGLLLMKGTETEWRKWVKTRR